MFGLFKRQPKLSVDEFHDALVSYYDKTETPLVLWIIAFEDEWSAFVAHLHETYAPQLNDSNREAILTQCAAAIEAGSNRRVTRKMVTEAFAELGIDFMSLHPTIHSAILDEAVLFDRIDRSVEMFLEVLEQSRRLGRNDDERAALTVRVYEERKRLLGGPKETGSRKTKGIVASAKRLWVAAGYSADVSVAFHRLFAVDLDALAKRARAERVLSEFCDKAQEKGLSAEECARRIFEHGWEDQSRLD